MRIWTWLLWASLYGVFVLMSRSINLVRIQSQLNDASLFANPTLLVGCFIVVLLFTSAFHELGHLIGGWFAGLELHTFVVGPLHWSRGQGFRFMGRNGFNGLTASLPHTADQLRQRMLAFAIGGPVASLLLTLIGLGLYWFTRDQYDPRFASAWIHELGIITAVISALFLLTTLRPGAYNNGMPADGGRILTLLQGGDPADRWCALVLLSSADIRGERPRDWDQALVERATAIIDGSYDSLTATLMAYAHAIDLKQYDQAEQWIEEAMGLRATWLGGARAQVALEKAFFYGFVHDDAEQANHWLSHVRLQGQGLLVGRALTAVALAQKEYDKAMQQANQTRDTTIASNPPLTGTDIAALDWLRVMQTKAERLANAQ